MNKVTTKNNLIVHKRPLNRNNVGFKKQGLSNDPENTVFLSFLKRCRYRMTNHF